MVGADAKGAVGRSVVLGAGFAGLMAAAVLAETFEQVIVLERDALPRLSRPRRGVPQSTQLHNLLEPAHSRVEALVPGFKEALVEAGAVRASVADETFVFELGRVMPKRDLGLELMSAPRPVIDQILHGLVSARSNIAIHEEVSVAGVELTHGRATGVTGQSKEGSHRRYQADVIVDALGAGSPACALLGDAGVEVPTEHRVVAQWYSTCTFAVPPELDGTSRYILVFPSPPATRGGLASPVGARGLSVSVSGTDQDDYPKSVEEFIDYAASLEDSTLAELLQACTATSAPKRFHRMSATWHHYERVNDPVVGLLPIGDAFATLNPLQGQGMSVATLEAVALRDALRESRGPAELTTAYLEAAAVPIQMAWDLAAIAGPDSESRFPWEYLQDLGRRFDRDVDLHRRYLRVWHLLEPVQVLEPDLSAPPIHHRDS